MSDPTSVAIGLMWLHLVLEHDESPDEATRKVHLMVDEAWSGSPVGERIGEIANLYHDGGPR